MSHFKAAEKRTAWTYSASQACSKYLFQSPDALSNISFPHTGVSEQDPRPRGSFQKIPGYPVNTHTFRGRAGDGGILRQAFISWVEFDGTSVSREVWGGRANLDEFETDGPSGHIEGLTLRLYNPKTHQWSLYWANSREGSLGGPPNVGEFKNGRGEFFSQDTFNGRTILVRYVWSDITANSARFEQSFSDDGGKTWEANWISTQTRVGNKPERH